MSGYLLEALLASCFEVLIRLERYLENIKIISSPYEQKVLELLEEQGEKCWFQLETARNLLQKESALSKQEYLQFLQTLFSFRAEVAKMISFFQYLPRPQVSPQVYVFLKGLFGSFYKDKFVVSLTNTLDDYKYCSLNLEEDVVGAVLCFPCLEKSNPLMWAMLVREYASFWLESSGITQKIIADLGKMVKQSSTEIINWGKELFADLIALKIMGPSFFTALAHTCQFKLLNLAGGSDNLLLMVRLDILNELLWEKGLEDRTVDYYWKIVKLAFQAQPPLCPGEEPLVIKEWQQGWSESLLEQSKGSPEPEGGIVPERDLVAAKQVVKEIILPVLLINLEVLPLKELKEFSPANLEMGNKLAGLLERGLPVGAKRKFNQSISRLLEHSDKDDIYFSLRMVEDEPAEYPEIIYAGWVYRQSWQKKEFELFFKNRSLEKTNLKKAVCFFDDLLLKSIQTAAVHKFFVEKL